MGNTTLFVLYWFSASGAELGNSALVLAHSGSVVQGVDSQHFEQQAWQQYVEH